MDVGLVTGRRVETNRDGSKNVVLMACEVTAPEDIQTVEHMTQVGEDSNPPAGSRVVLVPVGSAFKIAVATDDGVVPVTSPGEKRIYATDSGGSTIQCFIYLHGDGRVQLDNNAAKVELLPSGRVTLSNGAGAIDLLESGVVDINGFRVGTDGNATAANGVSLTGHTHAQKADSDGDTEEETEVPTVP